MNELTLTFNSPLTEEDWDVITDVDFDRTNSVWFHTKHGKDVEFVKVVRCEECIHNESSPHNPICSEGNRAGAGWFCADGERREDGET